MGNQYLSFAANITLIELQRNVSLEGVIECPGDTITYRCSINSNSETVQLEWMITFPGQGTFMMLYNDPGQLNSVDDLGMSITTMLTEYRRDEFIQSDLVLTVLQNVSMNGTVVECGTEDLASENASVHVNTSGNSHY